MLKWQARDRMQPVLPALEPLGWTSSQDGRLHERPVEESQR